MVSSIPVHTAAITSLCIVPTPNAGSSDTYLLGTSSHDLSARLTRVSLSSEASEAAVTTASLHLHTGPVSSVSADSTGAHLLTSSWDGLIGVWDTTIPTKDEVPVDQAEIDGARKRRKITDEGVKPKRKAPISVFKSHTGRVSKVIFANGNSKHAYSCGFDSTVRTWDVETGVCTNAVVSIFACDGPLNYLVDHHPT